MQARYLTSIGPFFEGTRDTMTDWLTHSLTNANCFNLSISDGLFTKRLMTLVIQHRTLYIFDKSKKKHFGCRLEVWWTEFTIQTLSNSCNEYLGWICFLSRTKLWRRIKSVLLADRSIRVFSKFRTFTPGWTKQEKKLKNDSLESKKISLWE